jgi:hypothetical protein
MTTFDRDTTEPESGRFCPERGAPAGDPTINPHKSS